MEIAKLLAVYCVSPPHLGVEAEDSTVLDLSLTELKDGGHRLSDGAWKELLEGYQLVTCRATPGEASRRTPSARQPRPPA